MKRSEYKLGSQLTGETKDGHDLFEWSFCFSFNKRLVSYVPLGIRTVHDPIVRLGHQLVDALNEAQPEE
jgi:hypothetical protein